MIKAVKLSQQQLVDDFDISYRLATRIGALRARGIGITPVLLEMAQPGYPVERFLLRPELLREADSLSPERLAQISSDVDADAIVLTTDSDGMNVLALTEEVEAAQAEVVRADNEKAPVSLSAVGTALQVINEEDSRRLFTPEEVSKVKMTVLTSADPSAKIEAIRRLALAPIDAKEKAVVLIHALRDPNSNVRVEAADALTALGLTSGIASTARSLGEGNKQQRLRAAERMSILTEKVTQSEIGVILTVLAGAIQHEDSAEIKTALIRSFKGACKVVAANRAIAAELVRLLVHQLEGAPEELYRPVREILGEIGRHNPQVMTALVRDELDSTRDRRLRRLLFGVMAIFPVPQEYRAELAAAGVADFEGSDTPEEECQGIGAMLCSWGLVAVNPLLAALPDAEDAQKIYIIRLLDQIASREDAAAIERVGEAFLKLLQISRKHVRLAVIESNLITHPALPADLKAQIATELLTSISDFANPRMRGVLETAATRLGPPALEAAKHILKNEENDKLAESASTVITDIVEGACTTDRVQLADGMLPLCLKEWEDSEHQKDYIAEAAGRLAVLSSASDEELAAVINDFMAAVFSVREPFGILVALSYLGASGKVRPELQFSIAETFFDLLDAPLPDVADKISDSTTNDDDEVHNFGREVTAYTELVPACLEGLEKIYFGVETKALRTRIIDFLIGKWNETAEWTTIWGPDAIEVLLEALAAIAGDPKTDYDRVAAVLEAFTKRLDFIPVVREIEPIVAQDQPSVKIGMQLCTIGQRIIALLPILREQELAVAINALGAIGARTNLGKNPAVARRLRERIVHVFYEHIKEGHLEAATGLEKIKDCPALRSTLREEIKLRLEIIGSTLREPDSPSP